MTMTVFYHPDPATDPDGRTEPRMFGLTVEQAAAYCGDYLVMWSPNYERFGQLFRTPTPYTRFFYHGREVINPWAFFRPVDPTPETRGTDEGRIRVPDDDDLRLLAAGPGDDVEPDD